MLWTDDLIEALKQHWESGDSASVIGKALGITRNSVIGKVFRLGLKGRKPKLLSEEERHKRFIDRQMRKTQARSVVADRRRKEREFVMIIQEAASKPSVRAIGIPFADLREFHTYEKNQCRYIADEPPGPDYIACGLETPEGKSYCEHCARIIERRPFELTQEEQERRRMHFLRVVSNTAANKIDHIGDAANGEERI